MLFTLSQLLKKGADEGMTSKLVGILVVSTLAIGLTACSNSSEGGDSSINKHAKAAEKATTEQVDKSVDSIKKDVEKENQDPTITALVNKQNSLDETYAPTDLVKLDVPTVLENPEINQLRKIAADALKAMFDDAKESDIYLYARSGYRSYQTQKQLFNNYVSNHGEEEAVRFSARPGQSEHQTGLAMDVTSESVNFQLEEGFGETIEGKWLREHGHEYGFIIRYPQGKENITGYIYEPWHIRYLGVELATEVYKSGLTYEEYLAKDENEHESE